jgi:hypothetical protein
MICNLETATKRLQDELGDIESLIKSLLAKKEKVSRC